MKAHDRIISEWYSKIQHGEIKLPRFQRFEAWDRARICSLLETVIQNLPLGITLVLDVGDEEKFISRFLETAPRSTGRVYEQLLDGQQRLTALWRSFQNNYESETYFVYLKEFDEYEYDYEWDDMSVIYYGRWLKSSNNKRYPLWCDDPEQCLTRGMIPFNLFKPEDAHVEIDDWIEQATRSSKPSKGGIEELEKYYDFKKRLSDKIKDLRFVVASYNLPYLSLPSQTEKTVALNVFINMNTNSKPLSTYDIIVAEVESAMGQSLHDLEQAMADRHPEIVRYRALSDLMLTTSALLQGNVPNEKGAWDMDKRRMIELWDDMEIGLTRMAAFLTGEGILDDKRLPTNAILAVISALYTLIPETGDKRGQDELLLKKYLWNAFFTDRYENSAASHAFSDFNSLKKIIQEDSNFRVEDVPIFSEHSVADVEELLTAEWPKRATIRGRGILAVACRLGALDFSTGEMLSINNVKKRHYHHIYPDALLKEAGINGFIASNCALITDSTNVSIGRKDPLEYLKDRYQWSSEEIVKERLESHLIPIDELANGGYGLLKGEERIEKIKKDFETFIRKRAELIKAAFSRLEEGRQLSAKELYS